MNIFTFRKTQKKYPKKENTLESNYLPFMDTELYLTDTE